MANACVLRLIGEAQKISGIARIPFAKISVDERLIQLEGVLVVQTFASSQLCVWIEFSPFQLTRFPYRESDSEFSVHQTKTGLNMELMKSGIELHP